MNLSMHIVIDPLQANARQHAAHTHISSFCPSVTATPHVEAHIDVKPAE
jgi:hypothetical protein